jgi:hypothetical protein
VKRWRRAGYGELLGAVIRGGTFRPAKVGHYNRRLHGERAAVRDWLDDRSWCTDCWVAEACRREAEWEALEI